jgi:uncharacterized repeat protein (TIGR03843 family)
MPWGSNYTFLGVISTTEHKFNVVYKPCQGERPLWDFEYGTLGYRETASYVVGQALGGWQLVPPTTMHNGPHGIGSVQLYIHTNYDDHYFTLKDQSQYRLVFQKMALFDYLVNNADRKGGHCLRDQQDRIWAIDHGLTFHAEYKLRTVIWAFEGQPIPHPLYTDLETFAQSFQPSQPTYQQLLNLLSPREVERVCHRLQTLLEKGRFPSPTGYRDYPYPPV